MGKEEKTNNGWCEREREKIKLAKRNERSEKMRKEERRDSVIRNFHIRCNEGEEKTKEKECASGKQRES